MHRSIQVTVNTIKSNGADFDDAEIAASGSKTSDALDLTNSSGECRLQFTLTGDGTATIEAMESLDNVTFFANPTPVAEGLTKTPGSGLLSYTAETVAHVKFKVTETGTSDPITVSLKAAIR